MTTGDLGEVELLAFKFLRRRMYMLMVCLPLYVVIQGTAFLLMLRQGALEWTSSGIALPLTMVMLGFLVAGGWRGDLPAQAQAMFDDEVTRANRADAQSTGFWSAIMTAMALYLLSYWQALTGAQAAFLVITVATAAAALHFLLRERRELRGLSGDEPAVDRLAGQER